MEGKKRPILIALIGFLTLLAAVLILISAAVALFASSSLADITGIDFGSTIGYGGFLVGIIILIIGLSIWRGWTIAWYIAVIIYILGVLGSIVSIYLMLTTDGATQAVATPFIVSLVICLLIVYYLFRPKVKEFFGV